MKMVNSHTTSSVVLRFTKEEEEEDEEEEEEISLCVFRSDTIKLTCTPTCPLVRSSNDLLHCRHPFT